MTDRPQRPTCSTRGRLAALGLAAALPVGCLAPRPGQMAQAEHGIVWADDAVLARAVAQDLDRLAPRVAEVLPHAVAGPVEVWMQDELALYRWRERPATTRGFAAPELARVHLRTEEALPRQVLLAHELAHLYMDETWRALPWALEEGLADWIGVEVAHDGVVLAEIRAAQAAQGLEGPDVGRSLRGSVAEGVVGGALPIIEPSPAVPWPVEFPDAEKPSTNRAWRGLGYVAVARAIGSRGLDGLRSLCEDALAGGRSEVDAADVLALAGLGADRAAWRRAVEDVVPPAEGRARTVFTWPEDGGDR